MIQLKDFKLRGYQDSIVKTAILKNTLVVLPTGLGKTAISIALSLQRLEKHPGSKIILTAPTKPLCQQHYDTFIQHTNLKEEDITLLTGSIAPKKRAQIFQDSKVIIATPQTLQSDIISKRWDLKEVSLFTVDESHRAVSDYAYTWVAKQYMAQSLNPKILALTASPGTDNEKIQEVCKNLFIEDIESRNETDEDVAPYIQQLKVHWEMIPFSKEFQSIADLLKEAMKRRVKELKNWGFAGKGQTFVSKTQLLQAQRQIQFSISRGSKDARSWVAISIISQCIKLSYMQELIETQGVVPFLNYVNDLMYQARTTKTKSIQNLSVDPDVKGAWIKAQDLQESKVKHPKLIRLKELVNEKISSTKDAKIIIFGSYRDTVSEIVEELNQIPNVKAEIFVGQSKKKGIGLSQKEQSALLNEFSNNKFNVLVGTSITEEGIDIPKVDLVVFFEPIASAIRSIQRKGRTARTAKGEVIILITEKTRDEVYHWVSIRKEKKMKETIEAVKKSLVFESQSTVQEAVKKKDELIIIADHREKASKVLRDLVDQGINVQTKTLEVGDYILADGIICERKTAEDMVNSLIDGRLMSQLKDLKDQAKKPFLILEGEQDLYSVRAIHPNAIRGMLASITLSYNIPIIYTKDPEDTAKFLRIVARRMQLEGHAKYVDLKRSGKSIQDQQLSIVGALPDVGPKLAERLLKEFKTLRKIFSSKKLDKIEGLGKKKADRIKELLDEEF